MTGCDVFQYLFLIRKTIYRKHFGTLSANTRLHRLHHWCYGALVIVKESAMGRLTISLSDERHLALKEAAARQHKSIREIIENSLDCYGIKTRKSARDYVAMARVNSGLSEAEAMAVAIQETQAIRQR